jgi:hypothetical protein
VTHAPPGVYSNTWLDRDAGVPMRPPVTYSLPRVTQLPPPAGFHAQASPIATKPSTIEPST